MFTLEEFVMNERTGEETAGVFNVDGGEFREAHWDPGLMRPYLHRDNKVYVDVLVGHKVAKDANGQPIVNARDEVTILPVRKPQLVAERVYRGLPVLNVSNASALTKDQWVRLDQRVIRASRKRLSAWADLRAAATLGGFDGMSTTILEHEMITDNGEAILDMDGISEGRNFAPKYLRQGLPLPIAHSDFHMSERVLAVSRTRAGQAQDLTRAEMAGRRVGELIESLVIGAGPSGPVFEYGTSADYLDDSKIWGYTNHPYRITKTDLQTSANMATNIASTGGASFLADVISMITLASAKNFYGPFVLYISSSYDDILDNDFKAASDKTIRQRVLELDRIQSIKRLDYLTGDQMLLIQMDGEMIQAVNGQEITTVQWDTKGGFQKNFKVLAIQVPLLKAQVISGTSNLVTPIVHGTTS